MKQDYTKRQIKRESSSEDGSVLAYILVILGLSAGILATMNKLLDNSSRSTKAIEIRGNVDSIRRIILKTFDCEKSLDLTVGSQLQACPAGKIEIRDARDHSLVDSKGKLGSLDFYVRAKCSAAGINFEFMRGQETDGKIKALADPLTGERKDFSNLFKNKFFCTGFFPGAVPEGGAENPGGLPVVTCAKGRAWAGTKDGVPVCISTREGLREASTCTPGTLPQTTTFRGCQIGICLDINLGSQPGTPGTCGPGVMAPAPKCSMTVPKIGFATETCQ